MANYIASSEELTAVADAIRAKGGTSEPLAFPDGFVSAIGAIQAGGGSLDHSVTFKDDSGNVVAVYSVIDGIGNIDAPSGVERKRWVDKNGNIVTFPIDPSGDMVIIADNSITTSDAIYEMQGFSKSEYPYLLIMNSWSGSSYSGIMFAKSMVQKSSNEYTLSNYFKYSERYGTFSSLAENILYLMKNKLSFSSIQSFSYAVDSKCATNCEVKLNGIQDVDDVVLS